jgi:hypothetical protein
MGVASPSAFSDTPSHTWGPIAEFLSRIVIEGTPDLQQCIKTLFTEFKDVFSDKLKAKSADIPPFDLEVDKNMWETFRNRCPVRVQTEAKQAEIQKQTQ